MSGCLLIVMGVAGMAYGVWQGDATVTAIGAIMLIVGLID